MAIKRIPCGGFFYDDESIEFDGDVMKVIGGGGDSGIIANAVISPTVEDTETVYNVVSVDKRVEELVEAVRTGKNAVINIELRTDSDSHHFAVPVAVGFYGNNIIAIADITLPMLLLEAHPGGSYLYVLGEMDDEESDFWAVERQNMIIQ